MERTIATSIWSILLFSFFQGHIYTLGLFSSLFLLPLESLEGQSVLDNGFPEDIWNKRAGVWDSKTFSSFAESTFISLNYIIYQYNTHNIKLHGLYIIDPIKHKHFLYLSHVNEGLKHQ